MKDRRSTLPPPSTAILSKETRQSILHRLRRLEGQVRGVQKMVEARRDCREVIHQVAAIKAAAHSLGRVVLEQYITACLFEQPDSLTIEEAKAMVQEAVREMSR